MTLPIFLFLFLGSSDSSELLDSEVSSSEYFLLLELLRFPGQQRHRLLKFLDLAMEIVVACRLAGSGRTPDRRTLTAP